MRYRIKKSKLEQFKKENKDKVINTVNIDEKYVDVYVFPLSGQSKARKV